MITQTLLNKIIESSIESVKDIDIVYKTFSAVIKAIKPYRKSKRIGYRISGIKHCRICGIELIGKQMKYCKNCAKLYHKAYYQVNKKRIAEYSRIYYMQKKHSQ